MPLNLAETRLSLEGYRIQVIEKLSAMQDPSGAHDVINEVDMVLRASGLSSPAQNAFWEALYTDLDVIAEERRGILGKETAAVFGAIIETAKTDVRRFLQLVSKES